MSDNVVHVFSTWDAAHMSVAIVEALETRAVLPARHWPVWGLTRGGRDALPQIDKGAGFIFVWSMDACSSSDMYELFERYAERCAFELILPGANKWNHLRTVRPLHLRGRSADDLAAVAAEVKVGLAAWRLAHPLVSA